MRFAKNISLFIVYPFIMLISGFIMGILTYQFFYPEYGKKKQDAAYSAADTSNSIFKSTGVIEEEAVAVSVKSERLSADTEYVVLENHLDTGELKEVTGKLPHKYIGMDREQFMLAMENFEAGPPLSEREKGFAGLQVASFSRERVTVQMFYRTAQNQDEGRTVTVSGGDAKETGGFVMNEDDGGEEAAWTDGEVSPGDESGEGGGSDAWTDGEVSPGDESGDGGENGAWTDGTDGGDDIEQEGESRDYGFYLAVYNNEVVAYLIDKKTLFINTGIKLDTLPEEMQKQIIRMLWVPDQDTLFRFLEAYSS